MKIPIKKKTFDSSLLKYPVWVSAKQTSMPSRTCALHSWIRGPCRAFLRRFAVQGLATHPYPVSILLVNVKLSFFPKVNKSETKFLPTWNVPIIIASYIKEKLGAEPSGFDKY